MSWGASGPARSARLLAALAIALLLLAALVASVTAAQAPDPLPDETPAASIATPTGQSGGVYLPLVGHNFYAAPTLFGVQMYGALDQPSAGLARTAPAHVSWARWPMYWKWVEPVRTTPPTYQWTDYDRSILAANEAGLRLILTIDANPAWAAVYASGPITLTGGMDHFVQFVHAVAERYDGDGVDDAPGSPRIDHFEFYNEPDAGDELRASMGWGAYWGHFGRSYANMLCEVYPAVKTANSSARVLMGGLALDWFEEDGGPFVKGFLDDVLAGLVGRKKCLDEMNFHAYPAFFDAWRAYGPGLLGKTTYVRHKLQQYGFGNLPIVVSEAGWHSNSPPDPRYASTPENQARYVPRLYAQALAGRVDTMVWFSWLDSSGSWPENGLLGPGLQPKPAYDAYQTASTWLSTARYERSLTSAELGRPDLEGYLLAGERPFYLLWTNLTPLSQTVGLTHTVTLPQKHVRLVDMLGRPVGEVVDQTDGQADGRVRVPAGPNPLYVEVLP